MLIVTLPASARHEPTAFAARARAAGADVLEVRGDLTPGLAPFESALPLLLAPRGGDLTALAARGAAWLDLEEHEAALECPAARRIASFHAYEHTPPFEELCERGERAFARGAQLVKIATTARSFDDLVVQERVRRALGARGPTTVLAMGPLAELARIRSPWLDASTYATLDEDGASAPGQLTLARHRALAGAKPPLVFGVFGGPVYTARSAGPRLFPLLFERHGVRAVYLPLGSDDAWRDLEALRALGVTGVSVTAPHKLAAARFADELTADARAAEAVNTLVFGERTVGHQFDALGIERGHPELAGRSGSVAVVGSGGVVPAVLLACRRLGLSRPTLYARNHEAASALARRLDADVAPLAALSHAAPATIVWTLPPTAASSHANVHGDGPEAFVPPAVSGALALDLSYATRTAFQHRAGELGYTVRDGAAMFVHQMLAQFEVFTGRTPTAGDAQVVTLALARS